MGKNEENISRGTGWMPLLSGMFRNFSPTRNDQGKTRSWWKSGRKRKNCNERGLARPAYIHMCACILFYRGEKGCGNALAMSFFPANRRSRAAFYMKYFRTKREQLKRERTTRYYCIHAVSRTLAVLDNSKLSRGVGSRYGIYVCVGVVCRISR